MLDLFYCRLRKNLCWKQEIFFRFQAAVNQNHTTWFGEQVGAAMFVLNKVFAN